MAFRNTVLGTVKNFIRAPVSPVPTNKNNMQKTKTIRKKDLAEFERYARPHMRSKTIQDFPNFSATGSIRGMKKMYYGENALLLRIGPFIYNVSSCPELWNFYKAV